ncbi:hypothetical protein AB0N39_32800, partial [Streptomyces cellulosae]
AEHRALAEVALDLVAERAEEAAEVAADLLLGVPSTARRPPGSSSADVLLPVRAKGPSYPEGRRASGAPA